MLIDLSGLDHQEVLIGLVLSILAVPVALWFGFRQLKRYRLIADTPTARVRSAHQGYVELIGRVMPAPDGPVRSPLTGRECVWYHFKVEKEKGSGKNRRWVVEKEGTCDGWFQLDDGSGVCQIDPAGAEVKAASRRRWYGHSPMPLAAPSRERTLFGLNVTFGTGRYRYLEELILDYETLYALGRFISVGGGRDSIDQARETGEIIRDWKGDYDQLLSRFDSNGDGQLDLQEWEQVQQQARREAGRRQRELQALPTMHVLNCPDDGQQPFLLSTYDEERLSQRYRGFAYGCFAVVLAASWMTGELLLVL